MAKKSARVKSEMTMARVHEKVDECHFFLQLVRESKGDRVKTGYFVSAFLCAFASIFYWLEHVVDGGKPEVIKLLHRHPDWEYLVKELRGAEVHRGGAVFYGRPKIRKMPQARRRLSGRFRLVWDPRDFTHPFDHEGAEELIQGFSHCISEVEKYLQNREELSQGDLHHGMVSEFVSQPR